MYFVHVLCWKIKLLLLLVFLTSPCGRIRQVVFICSSHRDTYCQFTFSHWPLSLRSVLSVCHISIYYLYWNELPFSPREIAKKYLLHESVTSFPVKTLNSRTRNTGIPVFAFNWDLVTYILYTKHCAISSTANLCIWPLFVPFVAAAAARGGR